ncbi:hypothetical protein [Butyrivibrio sp. AE3004]|uniref:hypothetical protein n=1 Tax=Butyrivibrio sp. AE3004 TaxID=1506994 RepID=UPI0004944931|nr:hypothetical protein [Butyrivibrio sp. AE3004]
MKNYLSEELGIPFKDNILNNYGNKIDASPNIDKIKEQKQCLKTFWFTDDTKIALTMDADDVGISWLITYTPNSRKEILKPVDNIFSENSNYSKSGMHYSNSVSPDGTTVVINIWNSQSQFTSWGMSAQDGDSKAMKLWQNNVDTLTESISDTQKNIFDIVGLHSTTYALSELDMSTPLLIWEDGVLIYNVADLNK